MTTGFYRINDRLFPEKNTHSFKKALDLNIFKDAKGKSMDQDIPPVKVSIPFTKLSKTTRVYIPHTRLTYDPRDSTDIGAFLYKGNVPHLSQTRKKPLKKLASIKECVRATHSSKMSSKIK